MTKPEWSSAPGFVAAVRLTLDSSSLPRPSSLLQDSTVCTLEDDLPFFLLSRPRSPRFLLPMSSGLPVWHFLRRLSSSAVTKVSAVESSTLSANTWSNHFRPRRVRPSRARASFNFSCNTAMSAGSWDETGGVLAAGGVQYAGDGNISLDIRLSTTFFPPLRVPRTSARGGRISISAVPTEGPLAR